MVLPGLAYQGEHSRIGKVRFVSQGHRGTPGISWGRTWACCPRPPGRQGARLGNAGKRAQEEEPFERPTGSRGMRKNGSGSRRASMPEARGTGPLLVEGFINDVTEKQKQDNTIRQENESCAAPESPMFRRRHRGQFAADHRRLRHRQAAAVVDNVVVYVRRIGDRQGTAAAGPSTMAAPGISSPLWRSTAGHPESLFESKLFGYKKGVHRVRRPTRKYLDQADGARAHDELGEISLMGQVKLLRAIEHGVYACRRRPDPPTGCTHHRGHEQDLLERVNEGACARLLLPHPRHPHPSPPLRERERTSPAGGAFLKAYPVASASSTWTARCTHSCSYDWPGNVRELQNVYNTWPGDGAWAIPSSARPLSDR